MNKEKFLSTLFEYLCVLPENQIEKTLNYYSEIIDDYKENGLTEEEAIQKIGDIKEISNKILEAYVEEINPPSKPNKFVGNIFKFFNSNWRLLIFALLVFGFPIWLCLALPLLIILFIFFVCIPIVLLVKSFVFFWNPFIFLENLDILKSFWHIGMSLVYFGAAAFYIACSLSLFKMFFKWLQKLSVKIKRSKFLKKVGNK